MLFLIVTAFQILSIAADDDIDYCHLDEIELTVTPYCHRPNETVALNYGYPFCNGELCTTLPDAVTPCPDGLIRGNINVTCSKTHIPSCDAPNVEFPAKPYCVPKRCEKHSIFEICVKHPQTVILESAAAKCPDGLDRGRRQTVCFIESDFESFFCPPGDRQHERGQLEPYCVPIGYEDRQLAPLKQLQPFCNGQPCFALNAAGDVCPGGWERGKRQFRCTIQPDVDECIVQFGKHKVQVPPYCYPDNEIFEYSPYCADGLGCIAGDSATGDCPSGYLQGPIKSVCAEPACPAKSIIKIQPYCEPIGQPSYLTRNNVALCGDETALDACPLLKLPTDQCPPGMQRGAMETICDTSTAMDDRPFTIRYTVRPYCVSLPIYITISNFLPSETTCGLNHPCSFLNATTATCPIGMFYPKSSLHLP